MFKRPHHQRIQKLLTSLNTSFLSDCGCYFGGGTAIVLNLGEYRESVDIDFLCASVAGYRRLRNTIHEQSLGGIFRSPVTLAREVRADRYGIRTFVIVDGMPIKFEIVSEGRIQIEGTPDPYTGVPTLSRSDMYAEKLLANADRWNDKSVASRDIIDLAMMLEGWGPVPIRAWEKVYEAYGASAQEAYIKAVALISDPSHLARCLVQMQMNPTLIDRIPTVLRATEFPDLQIDEAAPSPLPSPRP
ncbi:MAG: nucleotidyl transferase AbiEii/AbiGii toxin family protein [Pseudomonadota bacterium]